MKQTNSIIQREHRGIDEPPFFIYDFRVKNFSGIIAVNDWDEYREYRDTFHPSNKNYPLPYIELDMIGCYFLLNAKKEVIYIGKSSRCVRNRLMNHLFHTMHNNVWTKESDRLAFHNKQRESVYFAFFEVEKTIIQVLEAFLIGMYKPKYNKQFNKFSEQNTEQFKLNFIETNKQTDNGKRTSLFQV